MGYENRRYSVVPYREEWQAIFEREAALIRITLGDDVLYVEHVGGTAVPGLCGKPTIDIAAIVRDPKRIDAYNFAFTGIGYEPLGEAVAKGARLFTKNLVHNHNEVERLVNLHIFPEEHVVMLAMVDNRDYLIAHPEEAKRFGELKMRLFRKHAHDYAAYREDEEEYLESLTKKAKRWRGRRVVEEEDTGAI